MHKGARNRLIDRACFSRTLKKVMIIILMVISIIGVYDSAIMYFSYLDGKAEWMES